MIRTTKQSQKERRCRRMQLGKNLKIARQNSGYTQEEVSNILFVSQQTISNWEKEISTPSVSDLVKISNLYQVSVDTLLKDQL